MHILVMPTSHQILALFVIIIEASDVSIFYNKINYTISLHDYFLYLIFVFNQKRIDQINRNKE